MRSRVGLPTLLIIAMLAGPALGNDDQAACAGKPEPAEPVIAACTRLIETGMLRGRDLAVMFERRGSAHRARRDNQRAVEDFDQAIRLDPAFALAYASRGDVHATALELPIFEAIQTGLRGQPPASARSYELALADFNKAIALDPSLARAYYNRAYLHRYRERYGLAVEDYSKAIELTLRRKIEPDRDLLWAAYLNRGTSYRLMRQFEDAFADFHIAITANPRSAYAHSERAIAWAQSGWYDRSLKDFDKALAIDPGDEQIVRGRRRAAALKDHFDAALRDLDAAIERNPREAGLYVLRAAIEKAPERQIADLDKAISADPALSVAYLDRGLAHARTGERVRAIADFTRAIALDDRSAGAYAMRGSAYADVGENDKAIADLRRALTIDPTHQLARRGLEQLGHERQSGGNADDCRGEPDSTRRIEACTSVILADPQTAVAYFSRANAYRAKGRVDLAQKDYDKGIEIDANHAVAFNERGVLFNVNRSQPKRAIEDYDRAIALDPRLTWAYSNRGLAYGALGQYDRAIEDFNMAIALDPRFALAYGNRGLAYKSKGMIGEALANYRLALALDPASTLAMERLERLAAR